MRVLLDTHALIWYVDQWNHKTKPLANTAARRPALDSSAWIKNWR